MQVGEAASYDFGSRLPRGVFRLQLPIGTAQNTPTLIVLDSCYGAPTIASVFEDAIRSRAATGYTVVALSNPKSVYANLLQYWKLDAGDYQLLPHVLCNGLSGTDPGATKIARQIVHRLSVEGLDDSFVREGGVTDVNPDKCRLAVTILIADKAGRFERALFSPPESSISPSADEEIGNSGRIRLGWGLIVVAVAIALIAVRLKPRRNRT